MHKGILLALFCQLIALSAFSGEFLDKKFIENQLKEFRLNTKKFMNSAVPKTQQRTRFFDHHTISTQEYVQVKIDQRQNIVSSTHHKSSFGPSDRVEALVDTESILRDIKIMHKKNLTQGKVKQAPWSDDYWPIYKGMLGARYADQEFDYIGQWDQAYEFIKSNPYFEIFTTRDFELTNLLSPSEKYDLLLGKKNILTQAMWKEGQRYFENYGSIETWMGICHGWAPASYMLDRPLNKITVKAYDGSDLTFYPADIKALASLLWANTRTATRFVGGRCNSQEPEEDENGRVIEKDCIDTNPATWHMSVVNQIGISQLSFVMDATFDYEVWNQPILSYKYKYFNPISDKTYENINEAIVSIDQLENDKFKDYRSSDTRFVVGISMEVEYSVETSPVQRDFEDHSFDASSKAFYLYDLELNQNFEVIGGEWYRNNHPDFLWTPPQNTKALTYADYYLLGVSNWNGKMTLSNRWKDLAQKSAQKSQPLAKIVESLIQLSRK